MNKASPCATSKIHKQFEKYYYFVCFSFVLKLTNYYLLTLRDSVIFFNCLNNGRKLMNEIHHSLVSFSNLLLTQFNIRCFK